jgi:serine/threonine-protein kinase RsbW
MQKPVIPPRTPFDSFTISFTGAEDGVRDAIAQTLAQLSPLGLNEDETDTVELVLAEVLNNIVEHALAQTGNDTQIEIRADHDPRGLEVTIIDEGAKMPNGVAPHPRPPVVDVEMPELPEGGFGWFMIHTLAQDVLYARQDGRNHLKLRLAVGL